MNTNIKLALVGGVALILPGCSSLQPSNYVNYNTPYGNVVQASGRAANNAAQANESFNCPSCAVSGNTHSGSSSHSGGYNYNQDRDFLGEITEEALDTLSDEIGYSIDRSIREAFRH